MDDENNSIEYDDPADDAYDDLDDPDPEPVVLVVESCRRCGEVKAVNEEGYCSVGCELGFRPGEWWR